MILNLQTISII